MLMVARAARTGVAMTEVMITSGLYRLVFAVVAILSLFLLLRLLDHLSGTTFRLTFKRITYDPRSAALYFGLRFLGACILLGLLLS